MGYEIIEFLPLCISLSGWMPSIGEKSALIATMLFFYSRSRIVSAVEETVIGRFGYCCLCSVQYSVAIAFFAKAVVDFQTSRLPGKPFLIAEI